MPTLVEIDGFEHRSFTSGVAGVYDAVAGTPTAETTTVRSGTAAFRCNPSAATEYVQRNLPASTRTIVITFYVRFVTLPTADAVLFAFINANGNGLIKYDQATTGFAVAMGAAGDTALGPATVSTGVWYRVDAKIDTSGATAVLTCRIDGDSGTEGASNNAQTAADITSTRMGSTSTFTYDAIFDDYVRSVTLADYPIGAVAIDRLKPTADGTHSISGANEMEVSATGTDITNATTTAWQLVDDDVLDTTPTDYVNDVGTNAASYVEVTFADLTISGSVAAVRAYSYDEDSTGTGTSAARSWILLSTNVDVTPDLRTTADDPGTGGQAHKKMLDAPSGGWDRTKVNGLKARMGLGDGAPDVWFGTFMLEVALLPTQTVAITKVDSNETARTLTKLKQKLITKVDSTETSRALTRVKAKTITKVSDTESATTFTKSKAKTLGRPTDTETARSLTSAKIKVLGRPTDTEAATTFTRVKALLLGRVTDTEVARTLTTPAEVNRVNETEQANALTAAKVKTITKVSDTEAATTLTFTKQKLITKVTDTEVARTLTPVKAKTLGRVTDTEVSRSLTATKIKLIGRATDTEAATALIGYKVRSIAKVTDTEVARTLTYYKAKAIGKVLEDEDARTLSTSLTIEIGRVTDTEVARTLTPYKAKTIGQATDTEVARALTGTKVRTIGRVTDVEEAYGLGKLKYVLLGQALESEVARALTGAKALSIVQILEDEQARGLVVVGGVPPTEYPFELIADSNTYTLVSVDTYTLIEGIYVYVLVAEETYALNTPTDVEVLI